MKEIKINVASAFKYPPNICINCLKCFPTLIIHVFGKWCSIWSIIYILSTHIKYSANTVTEKYIAIVGIDVTIFINPFKKFLTHIAILLNTSPLEFCNTFSISDGNFNFPKSNI